MIYSGIIYLTLIIIFTLGLGHAQSELPAWRWVAGALLISGYILWTLWRHLPENHQPIGDTVYQSLGLPTHITLVRGFMIAVVAGFVFLPETEGLMRWIPGVLYLLAALFDTIDGYVARRLDRVTQLGQILDNKFDALGTLVAVTLGISLGKLPAWYIIVGLAYYLFIFGQWLRLWREKPGHNLPPDRQRSVFAGIQMVFLGIVLLPIYPSGATQLAATVFVIPTAVMFLRDWLVTSGIIDPDDDQYRSRANSARRLLTTGFLPLLRAGLFMLFVYSCILTGEYIAFTAVGLSRPVIAAILGGLLTLIVFGFAGRTSALIALLLLGLAAPGEPVISVTGIFFIGVILILILGTGNFSVWQPEERLLFGDNL